MSEEILIGILLGLVKSLITLILMIRFIKQTSTNSILLSIYSIIVLILLSLMAYFFFKTSLNITMLIISFILTYSILILVIAFYILRNKFY